MQKELLCSILVSDMFFMENDDVLQHFIMRRMRRSTSNKKYLMCILRENHFKYQVCYNKDWITEYTNTQFYQIFRMQKNTFHNFGLLLKRVDVKNVLTKPYSGGYLPVEIDIQALIFLKYMATQETLISIADRFQISSASVMKIINKFLYFVLKVKKEVIKFPKTEEALLDVARGFEKYPGVVGAIDGTHIFIKVPTSQQDSYIDRYRRHSINLMAICDSNKLFTYVFIGFPGSAHDSRVFNSSQFVNDINKYGANSIFLDDTKLHLIGDTAFGLQTWLMTPYKGDNLSSIKKHHNYCLSSDRVVIEHAFGMLKGRWRRLKYINTYSICKTIEIATAACILHNFCLLNNDRWDSFFNETDDEEEHPISECIPQKAQQKRETIARDLYNR